MIRAVAPYTLCRDEGDESIEVEMSTDNDYSPDLADDLAVRARRGMVAAIAEVWPAEVT